MIRQRQHNKIALYKKLIHNCCIPSCPYAVIETHHIIPIKKGGEDSFRNMINLCYEHHHLYRLHTLLREPKYAIIELLTWKFYRELEILGFTSDCSDDEFIRRLQENKLYGMSNQKQRKGLPQAGQQLVLPGLELDISNKRLKKYKARTIYQER